MKKILRQLLLIKIVRILVGKTRYYYYTKLKNKTSVIESEDAIDHTIKHNLKSLRSFGNPRMDSLIKPISILENISKNAKILVIGPRNEDDILNLIGHGFNYKNITGLDLISYSPFIEIGDMHSTRFDNSYFDVILCGWTLSYSNQPQKFAKEALRIIKDKGVIGIGVEYSTMTDEQSLNVHNGYLLKPEHFDRINSTDQILKLFDGHIRDLFFNHDAPNKISHTNILDNDVSSVITVFSINKN